MFNSPHQATSWPRGPHPVALLRPTSYQDVLLRHTCHASAGADQGLLQRASRPSSPQATPLCRLMYVLLFLQYSATSFYDPARRALEPQIVPKKVRNSLNWHLMHCLASQQQQPCVQKLMAYQVPLGSPDCTVTQSRVSHQVRLHGLPPQQTCACTC